MPAPVESWPAERSTARGSFVSVGLAGGAFSQGNARPESQSQTPSRHDSLLASCVMSRTASSGSRVSTYNPVKQAETSSKRREVSVGLVGGEAGCRAVVGVVGVVVDLAISIFIRWGEGGGGVWSRAVRAQRQKRVKVNVAPEVFTPVFT